MGFLGINNNNSGTNSTIGIRMFLSLFVILGTILSIVLIFDDVITTTNILAARTTMSKSNMITSQQKSVERRKLQVQEEEEEEDAKFINGSFFPGAGSEGGDGDNDGSGDGDGSDGDSNSDGIIIDVTAASSCNLWFWIDGGKVIDSYTPNSINTASVTTDTDANEVVLAAKSFCNLQGGNAGVLAEASILMRSNGQIFNLNTDDVQWKCKTEIPLGQWTKNWFNDDNWSPATNYGANLLGNQAGYTYISGIASIANWIGSTAVGSGFNGFCHCRGKLSIPISNDDDIEEPPATDDVAPPATTDDDDDIEEEEPVEDTPAPTPQGTDAITSLTPEPTPGYTNIEIFGDDSSSDSSSSSSSSSSSGPPPPGPEDGAPISEEEEETEECTGLGMQCDGMNWAFGGGLTSCCEGFACTYINLWWSECREEVESDEQCLGMGEQCGGNGWFGTGECCDESIVGSVDSSGDDPSTSASESSGTSTVKLECAYVNDWWHECREKPQIFIDNFVMVVIRSVFYGVGLDQLDLNSVEDVAQLWADNITSGFQHTIAVDTNLRDNTFNVTDFDEFVQENDANDNGVVDGPTIGTNDTFVVNSTDGIMVDEILVDELIDIIEDQEGNTRKLYTRSFRILQGEDDECPPQIEEDIDVLEVNITVIAGDTAPLNDQMFTEGGADLGDAIVDNADVDVEMICDVTTIEESSSEPEIPEDGADSSTPVTPAPTPVANPETYSPTPGVTEPIVEGGGSGAYNYRTIKHETSN